MRVTLAGTRGSLGSAGSETVRYGGDTSCVKVVGGDGTTLVLDGGSGIRPVGDEVTGGTRVDVLLSHLHMDHIQGLGFFAPMFDSTTEVHLWGPASARKHLADRLVRYLSPPLFPVRLRELPAVELHDAQPNGMRIGCFDVAAEFVIHPGPTVGYRIVEQPGGASLAYLPDHEPALGVPDFPRHPRWTSGFGLARGVDVLIHDCQYTAAEYAGRSGWGHSSMGDAFAFAEMAGVGTLVTFHHDPDHDDAQLDAMHTAAGAAHDWSFRVAPGLAGTTIDVG